MVAAYEDRAAGVQPSSLTIATGSPRMPAVISHNC